MPRVSELEAATGKAPGKAPAKVPATPQEFLDAALAPLRKQYGDNVVQRLRDRPVTGVPVVSSGSVALDLALGIGGLPFGRIVEIYGPEQGGKTTMALSALAEAQKLGLQCAFIDAEHALSIEYAEAIGVDTDDLLVSQPDSGEEALEVAEALTRSGQVQLIVIDSVAALTPRAEIEGEMGDSHMGLQARLMSQALRKLTAPVAQAGVCMIFINQLREKIGVMFGSPETTTGGKALKFYASVRLDVRVIEKLKHGSDIIGNRVRVTVAKNKLAPPFRKAELDIIFGKGVSREGSLIDIGVQLGFVTKAGSHYKVAEQVLGNGKAAAVTGLAELPGLADELDQRIRAWRPPGSEPAEPAATPDTEPAGTSPDTTTT